LRLDESAYRIKKTRTAAVKNLAARRIQTNPLQEVLSK